MKLAREPFLAGAVLLLVCIANGISRWQDPSVSRTELHADAPHFERTDMAVRALDRGENPFAGWLARRSSSYPALLVYQPLAHGVVVALHFVFPRGLLLLDLFVWVRFLAVALLPLSFFLASRLLRLGLPAAIIGALLAALIQAGSLAGDVFPQAVATHFLLLALGLAFRAVRGGRMLVLTAAVLGLTVLAHLLYGYLGALSLLLLAWMPDAEVPRAVRIQRAGQIGLLALPVAGLHLVPLVLDSAAIVWRPWDTAWRATGPGASQILRLLVTGGLLDPGRPPVITLLAFTGGALFLLSLLRGRSGAAQTYVLAGSVTWVVVFFGRAFWAPLLVLLGLQPDAHLHLVLGEAYVFVILLAALGLEGIWEELPWRPQEWSDKILLEPPTRPARPRPPVSSRRESW